MSAKKKALVVAGDGINCEVETAHALDIVGFQSTIRHINDLMSEGLTTDQLRQNYAACVIPGGFSFGDDLASGKVLALKLQHGLKWDFHQYADKGGLVLGICNGFQALIRMGVFGKPVSITGNIQGKFINKWVKVEPHGTKCIWLRGVGSMELPIRHGEGRVVLSRKNYQEALNKLERQQSNCLRYLENPNGSDEAIAGLCDITGRIFGLMPHPEGYVRWTAHPEWTIQPARAGAPGQGLTVFENAFQAAMESS